MVETEVVDVDVWFVIGGAAVVLLVFVGSVTAALLAVAHEVEQELVVDSE
ncbi:hypothetical protein ACLBWP_02920 [Microbacterium sp. M1A1_1b]